MITSATRMGYDTVTAINVVSIVEVEVTAAPERPQYVQRNGDTHVRAWIARTHAAIHDVSAEEVDTKRFSVLVTLADADTGTAEVLTAIRAAQDANSRVGTAFDISFGRKRPDPVVAE